MLYPIYDGLSIVPSRAASNEMFDLGWDLYDVLDILERGYDCQQSRRLKGTLEKCLDEGKKTRKAVVASSWSFSMDTEVWVVTHVGKKTKPKVMQ